MSGKDLKSWINDLGSEDEKVAGSARRRLVAHAADAGDPLLAVVRQPANVRQFRATLRVLGDCARQLSQKSRDTLLNILLEQLTQRDGAERRSIITCLSHVGQHTQT